MYNVNKRIDQNLPLCKRPLQTILTHKKQQNLTYVQGFEHPTTRISHPTRFVTKFNANKASNENTPAEQHWETQY